MILLSMPGHRKPTLGEKREMGQSDFLSGVKGILVQGLITHLSEMISGNMILPPIHGHRKPTSGEQQDGGQSDFPSAAKGI